MACGKLMVWGFWCWHTLLSVIYVFLALVTFSKLTPTTDLLMGDSTSWTSYRNSLMGSCFLGFILVTAFVLFSFGVLSHRPRFVVRDLKLAYGVMLGYALISAFFQLLAGLSLNSSEPLMQALQEGDIWTMTELRAYQACYVWSYIMCIEYLATFLILLLSRGALGKDELAPPASATADNTAGYYSDMPQGPARA